MAEIDGEVVSAEPDALMERSDWALAEVSARLDEADLSFTCSDEIVQVDQKGEKIVYSRITVVQPALTGLGEVGDDSLAAPWCSGGSAAAARRHPAGRPTAG